MSKRFMIAAVALGSSFSLVGLACSGDSGGTGALPDGGVATAEGGGATVLPGEDSGGGTGPGAGDDGSVPFPEGDGSAPLGDGSAPLGDGAAPPQGDGGPITDAATDAPPPPFTGIACGTSVCHVGAEVCCNRPAKTGRTRENVCTSAASCGDAGIPLACNKPADCANGEVCCAYEPRAGSITSISCAATCKREDGGASLYEVCDTDQSPACHFGGTCQVSTAVPSLSQPSHPLLVCK